MQEKLPAFKITYNDGSFYFTNMARSITHKRAKEYFLGKVFTKEENGKEIKREVVRVEKV